MYIFLGKINDGLCNILYAVYMRDNRKLIKYKIATWSMNQNLKIC